MTFWTALALATAVANPYVGTDVSGNLHVNSSKALRSTHLCLSTHGRPPPPFSIK